VRTEPVNEAMAGRAALGPARRMGAVQSPVIPVVAELIRRAPGTISLGQGVVYYGPPPESFEALARFAARPDSHKYGPVDGTAELRAALATKLERENGIGAAGRRVVVTAGGNMAFMNAMLALLDPGDEVVLPRPFYFNHEMAISMVGGRAVTVPTGPGFQLDPEAIRRAITPRTRAVVSVSPNNPTGAVYPQGTLAEVNEICRRAGIYHISDEAYEYFTYGAARHHSPASIPGSEEHTISLFSFSKAYGFASWRIGYMVVPEHLGDAIAKIQDTILICPPVVSQYAAVGALEAGAAYCREKGKAIAATRELVLRELEALHPLCAVSPADGALYFLVRVDTALPAMRVVERLIDEHRVAAIPGDTFGLEGCWLRVSYGALEHETVAEGVGRLVEGIRAIART
jgi:aspartate/methionine/tyrosine aminotransferase